MHRRHGHVTLERALSKLGLASRTDARELIGAGRVRVDARVVTDPRHLVVPERVAIAIDDEVRERTAVKLIAFHKPRGVVTTRRDPQGRRTVFDVIGDAAIGLQAIGRLDLASTGLLLFTNDTRLANALTDPSRRVMRRYAVTVRGRVTAEAAAGLARGVDVPVSGGRPQHLSPVRVTIRKTSARETHLIVDLVEGKNREIRRLFGAIDHEVTRVHRVQFGPIVLGELQVGQWREEDPARVK